MGKGREGAGNGKARSDEDLGRKPESEEQWVSEYWLHHFLLNCLCLLNDRNRPDLLLRRFMARNSWVLERFITSRPMLLPWVGLDLGRCQFVGADQGPALH